MKFHPIALFSSVAVSLLLPSCATKFSPAQRAELSTVAVAQTIIDPEAYEEPYAGDIQARNAAQASAGASGGMLGSLIGLGVGSAIAGTQNSHFKSGNESYFPAVQKNTPGDLTTILSSNLKNSLKKDAFFKPRIADQAGATVTSEISCHRLIRLGKNDKGDLLFTPEIYATIQLKNAAGKKLAGGDYTGSGVSALVISEYAASPAKTRQAFTTAVNNAIDQFMADLAIKTAE